MNIFCSVTSNSHHIMRLAVNLLVGLNILLIVIVLGCMLSKNEQQIPYERHRVNLKLP